MNDEQILARVRKLLNLAENEAATEGERDNAMRMAHNMLTKHQLDMADLSEFERERSDPRGRFEQEGRSLLWAKHIRMAIAELFMCKYYFGRKINADKCMHHFVGRESQATTAMYLSEWIIKSVLKEGVKRYRHDLAPETRAFATGVSNKLYERVRELRAAKQAEIKATGNALVLVDLAKSEAEANEEFLRAMGTKLTSKKSRHVAVDMGAYAAGKEYGATINLNTQLGGGATKAKVRIGK